MTDADHAARLELDGIRVEQIGSATLYCGDALRVLPTLSGLGGVVTDPPYSSGGMYRGDRMDSTASKYVQSSVAVFRPDFAGDNRDQRAFEAWCAVWLGMALAACQPGAPIAMFTDWRQLPTTTDAIQSGGWIWRGIVPWDKTATARPQLGRFRAQCEYVVWGSAGALDTDRQVGALPGLLSCPVERDKDHIAQKPVRLLEDVLAIVEPEGRVLDPFMGAGTTGVAAMRLGRPFVGIELQPSYFETACERISAADSQMRLFA